MSPEAWERFWEAVEAAGAFSWAPDYDEPGVMDGTSWAVTLEHQGRRVATAGANATPEGFEAFQSALESLVGGRTWR